MSCAPAITRSPSATNAVVTARSIPRLTPVTTATLLFNPRSTAVFFDRHPPRSVTRPFRRIPVVDYDNERR